MLNKQFTPENIPALDTQFNLLLTDLSKRYDLMIEQPKDIPNNFALDADYEIKKILAFLESLATLPSTQTKYIGAFLEVVSNRDSESNAKAIYFSYILRILQPQYNYEYNLGDRDQVIANCTELQNILPITPELAAHQKITQERLLSREFFPTLLKIVGEAGMSNLGQDLQRLLSEYAEAKDSAPLVLQTRAIFTRDVLLSNIYYVIKEQLLSSVGFRDHPSVSTLKPEIYTLLPEDIARVVKGLLTDADLSRIWSWIGKRVETLRQVEAGEVTFDRRGGSDEVYDPEAERMKAVELQSIKDSADRFAEEIRIQKYKTPLDAVNAMTDITSRLLGYGSILDRDKVDATELWLEALPGDVKNSLLKMMMRLPLAKR